ncbi:MAG: hypothetical protein IKE93_09640 [Erysipelotrichaceae bacterium]|nr:hypothetical protein [Erysipelotrichaceae bacterium]
MVTKKERIYNAVNGLKTDRQPYAMWTHLPGIDLDPVKLAETTYQFYKEYDIDLIKTMNNGMYAVEDFGCIVDYSEVAKGGVSKVVSTPVNTIDDWKKIKPVSIEESVALKRELYSLKLLLDMVKDEEVPVLFTVFSPFTTANKLCGGKVLEHIATGQTEDIHKALQAITESTVELVKEAIRLGASGVYFATQMSNYSVCSEEVFREFGACYDKQVLEASDGFADAVHCHGSDIMYDILKEYPVDIFNWHAGESLPTIEEAKKMNKCLMGGIIRGDITESNHTRIREQIRHCWDVMGGIHHILSPGCVIRYPLNTVTLKYIRKAIDEITEN